MAAYRRRSDGILEIVRTPPKRGVRAISITGAALSLALVPSIALALYISMGAPPVILIGVSAVALLWQGWARRRREAADIIEAPPRIESSAGQQSAAGGGARQQ